MERRSDGVNERWRLFGTKKRRRERYEVREKEKTQIEAQRKRVQFGKEEQRSERALTIILKEKSSEQAMRSLLRRWCERWDLNPHACK